MIYAQINKNVIVNTVQIEDSTLVPQLAQGYDLLIQIDILSIIPAIGWIYSPVTCSFSPSLTLAQTVLTTSINCGNQIIIQWNALNLQEGIYQAGQTIAFLTYVTQLYQFLSLGYLNDANDAITVMIADTSTTKTELCPFITDDILNDFQSQLQDCLSSLPSLD